MSKAYDHRQLADEMDIFVIDEQVGAGLPMWLPNGVSIREALESFIKRLEHQAGYLRVASPHVAKAGLYEKSGHLGHFREDMFPPMKGVDDRNDYYLRPMNCPHHHLIFSSCLRSYRQLPLRFAEYGQVYRFENSGSLRGVSRVRGLCQNDAHIYVEPEKAADEISSVLDLHEACYKAVGLKDYRYRLSKHSQPQVQESGHPHEKWLQSESILRQVLKAKGLPFFEAEGEAAFYGPKIDVQMKMISGQEESIASVQLDFISAERFSLSYINRSGAQERPWIIHRAPLGSHERFVALLLEVFQGQLPGWLAPHQIFLIPVSENEKPQADAWAQELRNRGIRVAVEASEGSLSKKIKQAHRYRPYSKCIVGKEEVQSGRACLQFRDFKREGSFPELIRELESRIQPPMPRED